MVVHCIHKFYFILFQPFRKLRLEYERLIRIDWYSGIEGQALQSNIHENLWIQLSYTVGMLFNVWEAVTSEIKSEEEDSSDEVLKA